MNLCDFGDSWLPVIQKLTFLFFGGNSSTAIRYFHESKLKCPVKHQNASIANNISI